MTSLPQVITLPFTYLILVGGGSVLFWLLWIFLTRQIQSKKKFTPSSEERDWRIPIIDSQSGGDSLFHRWDPRIKLCSLAVFMFCVASLTQLFWASIALITALIAVAAAHIPFQYPFRRVAAMGAFLSMFLVVMPLTAPVKPADTRIVFEGISWMQFNLRGFFLALVICLKAIAIALLTEPLLSTAPFSVTIQALARLNAPPILCQMLLLAHRYIFVFQDEAGRMLKGMRARGFKKQSNMETVRTLGNFLGMLLVRSFDRTQRVFDAMTARGYTGTWPNGVVFRVYPNDWIKGVFWVMLGFGMLICDRWPGSPV
ncbi:MAG: cobalt ECF transporter T component CbiQ [Desulfatirhabdiaceae bacterium]